jgi:hypothetical protein
MFLETMKRQGWDKEQYSVYEGPSEDYYDIGRIDRPLNGWQHYNQQMNFWSDIDGAQERILITGLGGEMFKYIAWNVGAISKRVKNENLNVLIDHYPHEGQWEGYWRRIFKELIMPFWSYEYLKVSTCPGKFCTWVGETDSVRAAVVESYIDTHGVDCRNIEYGRHDYSWNLSRATMESMNETFYASQFYKDYGSVLPKHLDFFDLKPGSKSRKYDGCIWGLMTTYEEMVKC